jgi:ubiquinone/menaquinone biosynthesis C-methylase UbiE
VTAHPILAPLDAYRLWAEGWDNDPSAIVALESRYLTPWLADLSGRRVLDISCGTGRWLEYASRQGADIVGLDFCHEMLARAAGKAGLASKLAVADAARLPVPHACADLVLCTLSLGHVRDAAAVIAEMGRAARVGGTVIVTDFHPEAFRRGWKRTFKSAGQTYEVENFYHSLESLVDRASCCGLALEEAIEPCFGEPERHIFVEAGKPSLFDEVRGIPAVLLVRWRKLS